MKYMLAVFAGILLLGIAAGVSSRVRARPALAVDRIEHDFGRVRYGDVSQTTFKIRNVGNVPVLLSEIRTSCGCTKAEASQAVIAASESSTISVSFDPAVHKDDSDLGDIERTIYVKTNDPKHPELTFRIHASVYK